MTKLKNVEEVANRLEPIFTQSDAYEFDNGYTSLIPAIELAKQVITQDRQAIYEALREKITNMKGVYSAKDAIDKAVSIIDELLGGEVTE